MNIAFRVENGTRTDTTLQNAYRFSVDEKLLEFIDSVSAMESKNAISKRKHTIGKISETHAKIVEDVLLSELGLDIDAEEYTINIDGSAIKHIMERHGVDGFHDHSMEKVADIARIGWVVNNADLGYIARTKDGDVDYSTQYKNADGSPSPKIILEKSIGDGKFVVVECVPDTAAKKIHIISARKIKNGNGQVLNIESVDSPQPTSKTPLDGIATTTSIPQPAENVNPQPQGADDETRYALDEMSEEQYNSFGWASEADAMSGSELDDLHAKIQARKTLRTFKQSARGEAIIEVNNDPYATLGVNNVFVFVKGTKNNFTITRVVRADVAQ